MHNLVMLVGEPGAGKTRIARRIVEWLGEQQPVKIHEHKYKEVHSTLYFPHLVGVVGTYTGAPFDGTDKLALHTQPQMLELLAELPSWSWFLEGDRYATPSFIEKAQTLGTVHVVSLLVPASILEQRRKERGSDQNPTWLAGRHTKFINLTARYATVRLPHIGEQDTERAVAYVKAALFDQLTFYSATFGGGA